MLFNVLLFIWLQLLHVLFYTSYFFIVSFTVFNIISITITCPLVAVVKKFPCLQDK